MSVDTALEFATDRLCQAVEATKDTGSTGLERAVAWAHIVSALQARKLARHH